MRPMSLHPLSAKYKKIVLQFLLLAGIYQLIRLLFFVINHSYFGDVSIGNYLYLAFQGLRFDLSVIFSINLPYLFLALLPFPFASRAWYLQILNILFLFTNSLGFLFDLGDIGYFPYVRKRMTAEVFHLIGKKSDFIDLLPSYLTEFWFVPLAAILFILLFIFLNRRIRNKSEPTERSSFTIPGLGFYFLTLGLSVVIIRGGFQLKPIMNINALLVASNEHTPLVLNTPFSILHTFEEYKLERLNYFREDELIRYFNPLKNYSGGGKKKELNVVIIVLESFGKQYTGIGGRKSVTPFLDSLMSRSLVFTNAFANAHRSADGIPAILASIPACMEEPFMTSAYSNNTIDALPTLLRSEGYTSSFFHGGTNGTMSFDIFSRSAGFDKYVGRTEYKNDKDYDGTWGIWDEPFLQFYADELDKEKQPFLSSVFTLSSHEPFRLPAKYKETEMGQLKGIYKGIAYTDMALKKFFERVASKPWFQNTLFVLTADHSFMANNDSLGYYNTGMGLYSIPIILYHPGSTALAGYQDQVIQQIDIMPTVLDYLHYPRDFFSYGSSAFDTLSHRFVYTQMGAHTQLLSGPYVFTADNLNATGVYDFSVDSLLRNPLHNDSLQDRLMRRLKAFRQLLQNTLIDDKQSLRTFRTVK